MIFFTHTTCILALYMITHTMTRAKRAEDDYDYPEDLPQIVINRLKATTSPAMINQEAS